MLSAPVFVAFDLRNSKQLNSNIWLRARFSKEGAGKGLTPSSALPYRRTGAISGELDQRCNCNGHLFCRRAILISRFGFALRFGNFPHPANIFHTFATGLRNTANGFAIIGR
jgi:hypothetical protein